MSFKPIDPKRDEFRRYLERNGVIESLTKVFVRIVKERPENPLDYLRHNLGDALQEADTLSYLQTELNETNAELLRLRNIIQNINPQILEEFDKEKQQQKQQAPPPATATAINVCNGGANEQPVAEVLATAAVANVVSESDNEAGHVDGPQATSMADSAQTVENQQKTELEQGVKECHISSVPVSEDEAVKVAQNTASVVDESNE